jgi:zinc transport system permease protein
MLLAFLTAITIVVGMRIMGTLLISSLTVFPALTAMRLSKNFKSVIITSSLVSVVCFFVGIIASFNFDLPAGASIVMANLGAFIVFWVIGLVLKRE